MEAVQTMTPRYYFALPDTDRPRGGTNVQYLIIDTLRAAGYEVAALHGGSHYRYPFAPLAAEVYCLPALTAPRDRSASGRVNRLIAWLRGKERKSAAVHRKMRSDTAVPPLQRQPGDVFVLPEFAYDRYAPLFPGAPLVLAAQDVFGLANATSRDLAAGGDPRRRSFSAIYTTSQAANAAVQTLLERVPLHVGLPIDAGALTPLPKKFQIAYLPRKRQEESEIVLAALKARLGVEMPAVVPIAGMSDEERNRIYRESLFFLSFSRKEGFGLPPAEAMAAGCIVVGYTGVGGNEYFTSSTGFPVEDSDIIGFIGAAERIIRSYRTDPAPLDALRLAACNEIRAAYDPDAWRRRVCAVWAEIDAGIRAMPERREW